MSKQYSQAFKDQVVHERLQTKTTIKRLSGKYAVGISTIHKWLKAYGHPKGPNPNLINVTDLVRSVKITFTINGYEIICDDHALPIILKGLRK
jgi:transposase-like protein